MRDSDSPPPTIIIEGDVEQDAKNPNTDGQNETIFISPIPMIKDLLDKFGAAGLIIIITSAVLIFDGTWMDVYGLRWGIFCGGLLVLFPALSWLARMVLSDNRTVELKNNVDGSNESSRESNITVRDEYWLGVIVTIAIVAIAAVVAVLYGLAFSTQYPYHRGPGELFFGMMMFGLPVMIGGAFAKGHKRFANGSFELIALASGFIAMIIVGGLIYFLFY